MTAFEQEKASPATVLCKACGLCCSGHLFTWVKLRSPEVPAVRSLRLRVLGTHPRQRGFNQPCPLWNGECTIYHSPEYPRSCKTYRCKLLKNLLDGTSSLPDALAVIRDTKDRIGSVESILPASSNCNFRERVVAHLESENASPEFQQQAYALLQVFRDQFGVKDILEASEEL